MALIASGVLSSRIDRNMESHKASREDLQDILVSIAYQACRGNPNWANELLQKAIEVRSVHIKPMTIWLETYAPLVVKNGEFVINKGMAKTMHVESEADFAQYEVEMRKVKWWDMVPKQKAESIFEPTAYIEAAFKRMAKKLNDEGSPDLANAVKKLVAELYTTAEWKAKVPTA